MSPAPERFPLGSNLSKSFAYAAAVAMPSVILLAVAIVGDAANYQAVQRVHYSRSLHLETKYAVFLCLLVAELRVFDDAVS